MVKREESSSRLRHTERLAHLCDFEYNRNRHKYGGFFSVFQLEKLVRTIEGLQFKSEELKNENDILKEKQGLGNGQT